MRGRCGGLGGAGAGSFPALPALPRDSPPDFIGMKTQEAGVWDVEVMCSWAVAL